MGCVFPKKNFLYVVQHKTRVYACVCKKKVVPLRTTYGVGFGRECE